MPQLHGQLNAKGFSEKEVPRSASWVGGKKFFRVADLEQEILRRGAGRDQRTQSTTDRGDGGNPSENHPPGELGETGLEGDGQEGEIRGQNVRLHKTATPAESGHSTGLPLHDVRIRRKWSFLRTEKQRRPAWQTGPDSRGKEGEKQP